jgi:hypothetical protein
MDVLPLLGDHVYVLLRNDVNVSPVFRDNVDVSPLLHDDVSPLLRDDVDVSPMLCDNIDVLPLVRDDVDVSPLFHDDVSPLFHDDGMEDFPLGILFCYEGKHPNLPIKYACPVLVKSRSCNCHQEYHLGNKGLVPNAALRPFFGRRQIKFLTSSSQVKRLFINM